MIVGTLLALVVQASAQPSASVQQQPQALGSLNIPREIGPAIEPYVRCKFASAGIGFRSSAGGGVQAPSAAAGTDCSQVRAQAAVNADRMLREQGGSSEAERRALVERTLASVDNFLPVPARAMSPTQTPSQDK